jgi:hypothetical protein
VAALSNATTPQSPGTEKGSSWTVLSNGYTSIPSPLVFLSLCAAGKGLWGYSNLTRRVHASLFGLARIHLILSGPEQIHFCHLDPHGYILSYFKIKFTVFLGGEGEVVDCFKVAQ